MSMYCGNRDEDVAVDDLKVGVVYHSPACTTEWVMLDATGHEYLPWVFLDASRPQWESAALSRDDMRGYLHIPASLPKGDTST